MKKIAENGEKYYHLKQKCAIEASTLSYILCKATIATTIRLRFDYDSTAIRRQLYYHSTTAIKTNASIFRRRSSNAVALQSSGSRIVLVIIGLCELDTPRTWDVRLQVAVEQYDWIGLAVGQKRLWNVVLDVRRSPTLDVVHEKPQRFRRVRPRYVVLYSITTHIQISIIYRT